MNRWLGSVNHMSITVADLDAAMAFFGPMLEFLGYTHRERGENSGTRVAINLNPSVGIAFNIWEAKGEQARNAHRLYDPGFHHIAFNADSHARVEAMAALVERLGGTILDGPGEFPFGIGGYYAVYFLGPDNLKFEFVHMPAMAGQFGRA